MGTPLSLAIGRSIDIEPSAGVSRIGVGKITVDLGFGGEGRGGDQYHGGGSQCSHGRSF